MNREEVFIRLPQGVPAGVDGPDSVPEGAYIFSWAEGTLPESSDFYSLDRDGRIQRYAVDTRGNLMLLLQPSAAETPAPALPPAAPHLNPGPAPAMFARRRPGFIECLVQRVRWQAVDKAFTWVGGWFLGAAALYVAYQVVEAALWAVARAVSR